MTCIEEMVTTAPDGLLQKQQYVHGLKYYVIIAPHSILQVTLHEFQNSRWHQGKIHTFDQIRRFYWWPTFCQDIVKHIYRCNICVKNLPNMVKYPHQNLQIL